MAAAPNGKTPNVVSVEGLIPDRGEPQISIAEKFMASPSLAKQSKKSRKSSQPLSPSLEAALLNLNTRVCYIKSTSEIARIHPSDLTKLKIPTMSCRTFANEAFRYLKVGKAYVAKEWMEWPERRTVADLVYSPGQERFTQGNLNTWFPSSLVAKESNVTPFTDYLTQMFASDPQHKDWFIASIAYPLQHPGAKLSTASLWWSMQQGNGKSTFGWIMRQLYGLHNSADVDANSIGANFNTWAENIQFASIDEMRAMISNARADDLKSLVTRPMMTINSKYRTPYETRDTINYFFSSNHPNALHLDPADRRFFVHDVSAGCSQTFMSSFIQWLREPDSLAGILYYLLHIDLSAPIIGGDPFSPEPAPFRPGAPAPRTQSRMQMIEASRDDVDVWLDDFIECMEDNAPTLWTTQELYNEYVKVNPKAKESPQMLTRRIKPRLIALADGQPVALADNNQNRKRLFMVRDDGKHKQRWSPAQLRTLFAQERGESCAEVIH